MQPRYEYGAEVRVIRNIRNDGTFAGKNTGQLLVRRGSIGYVKDVGTFLQDQVIYSVHFIDDNVVVGCRAEELIDGNAAWIPSEFEFRDKVKTKLALGVKGNILAEKGEQGEILKVLRDTPGGVAYHVIFPNHQLQVPETALEAVISEELE
ncbi:nitrogen fixation protein NifZ [Candidatus Albibeggiatoa sp. nov. BB20]|uniref:nitrogen fixation protein NifZ n=1 Tax=Candidatus Albibeggiatoa sp. nov. BB20 TaxID=3162723 RepID=UPI003365815B